MGKLFRGRSYAVAVNPETQLWDLFVAAAAGGEVGVSGRGAMANLSAQLQVARGL